MTGPELIALAKKNPVIAVCGLLSLALAVTIYFRSSAIEEANQELDAKSAEARRYELNINNANQLKEHYEALVAANTEIQSRLIHVDDIGINQQYFYKLESDNGVKLVELNQGSRTPKAAPGAHFVPVTFTVAVQGDFPQVITFLRALESGSHFYRATAVSCSAGRTGPTALNITLELLAQP